NPFGKERTSLGGVGLVRTQVDHRRVSLDLPEVGQDGSVEGEVRPETHLQVATDLALEVPSIIEGIVGIAASIDRRSANHVRKKLDPVPDGQVADPSQLTEPRGPPLLRPRHENPVIILVLRWD